MSYHVIEPPRRPRTAPLTALLVALALVALALLAGWKAATPVRIVVDGKPKSVRAGATIEDLADAHVLATYGDLIGVDGSVALPGGGAPPRVMRNGRPAVLAERVFPGDVIVSAPGADTVEEELTIQEALPFETRYLGSGSLTELRVLGSPGRRRVTRGKVSGVEVTSTVLQQPVDMVIARVRPTTGRLVALTFDDGPWPGQTERILKILEREGVPATFFMVGVQVNRHKALARRVVDEGHDIGTHTYGHVALSRVSAAQARKQIRWGKAVVDRATTHDTEWIRPPYGAMNAAVWREVRKQRLRAVLWDVDSRDWTKPGAKRIEATVLRTTKPGSVVLFHDGGGDRRQTIAALPRIIRRLKAQGYTFVTVDELVDARGKAAAANKAKARKVAAKRARTRKVASGGS